MKLKNTSFCNFSFLISSCVVIMLLFSLTSAHGQQLDLVSPIVCLKNNNADSTTSFVVSSNNYNNFQSANTRYINAIQIVSANKPWPPAWYTYEPLYSRESYAQDSGKNAIGFSLIGLPSFETGSLSYLKLMPAPKPKEGQSAESQFDFFFIVLDKSMNRVDTIRSRAFYGGRYDNNFGSNDKVEKLWSERKEGLLDLSKITLNPADTAIRSIYSELQVLNKNDEIIWRWNPIFHLSPELFQVKEKLALSRSFEEEKKISWLRLEDFSWDYDGNILYSLQVAEGNNWGLPDYGGAGKISRSTGTSIWQVGCWGKNFNDTTSEFPCMQPFNLNVLQHNADSAVYSFYDRGGADSASRARGIVFVYDNKSKQIRLNKTILSESKFLVTGHGGFDYDPTNGNYFLEYGAFEDQSSKNKYNNAMQYGVNDSVYAVFQLPVENYSFGAHRIKSTDAIPARPVIMEKGGKLTAAGYKKCNWYVLDVESKVAKKVSGKAKFTPKKDGIYCVEVPYGIGYSVSLPYVYATVPK